MARKETAFLIEGSKVNPKYIKKVKNIVRISSVGSCQQLTKNVLNIVGSCQQLKKNKLNVGVGSYQYLIGTRASCYWLSMYVSKV